MQNKKTKNKATRSYVPLKEHIKHIFGTRCRDKDF